MKIVSGTLLLLSIVWLMHGCKHDEEVLPEQPSLDTLWRKPPSNGCEPGTVYFENHIQKLLVSKCGAYGYERPTGGYFVCHGQAPYEEGINLTTYEGVMQIVDKDHLDEPERSEILEVIDETDLNDKMPLGGRGGYLTNAERDLIYTWILQGAQNNKCNACSDIDSVSYTQHIAPMLFNNCRGCHNDDNSEDVVFIHFFNSKPASINDLRYDDIKGNLRKIQSRMTSNDLNTVMPRSIGKLYECEYELLSRWIDEGALKN